MINVYRDHIMTKEEARDILIKFNLWRRDECYPNSYEMPNPKEIGVAIDIAIECLSNACKNKQLPQQDSDGEVEDSLIKVVQFIYDKDNYHL